MLGTPSYAADMPRRWRLFPILFVVVFVVAGCIGGANQRGSARPLVSLRGLTMGSHWSVKYTVPDSVHDRIGVQRALQSVLDRLESQMSTWRDDSELSRFNHSQSTEWFAVPIETARIVAEAQRISKLTEGAFDVTVLPLLKLWGFGSRTQPQRVPAPVEVAAARVSVGWKKLEVRMAPPALRKMVGGLQVDLSGIAPGFAADELGSWLEGRGIANFLVDVGGELRARGTDLRGDPWRVGIERPANSERVVDAVVSLNNVALATSGDYRNFFEQAGKRYSHIFDPRTGAPSQSGVASVSVVHPSAMTADALATALAVMGMESGLELAQREGWAVRYVERRDGELLKLMTPAFRQMLAR